MYRVEKLKSVIIVTTILWSIFDKRKILIALKRKCICHLLPESHLLIKSTVTLKREFHLVIAFLFYQNHHVLFRLGLSSF